jgi:glycosyltransferase involved in cell wall biosynthesis
MQTAPLPRQAYLLANTPIPDDPRVRRVGDLLHAAGWSVTGLGVSGWRSPPPPWPVLAPSPPQGSAHTAPALALRPGSAARETSKALWRAVAGVGAAILAPAPALVGMVSPRVGDALERSRRSLRDDTTWPVRQVRRLRLWAHRAPKWVRLHAGDGSEAEDEFLFRTAPHLREIGNLACAQSTPGLWIANDWQMLPLAAAAAARVGGRYVYDSHEFATEEYAERLSWRLFQKPIAAAVEKRWIAGAAAIVSVSPTITRALVDKYALTAPHDTIRNTPTYAPASFRPTGTKVAVLYHGVVAPGRGLEDCIRAAALWPAHVHLSIRGPSALAGYREGLEQLIAQTGTADRVRLLPPVPMTDLVREASAFDVGLFALPGHSAHNRAALPNKLFEYMMAGLALCVSNLPAMTEVVRESGAGITFAGTRPEAIAAALAQLTPAQIDAHKRAALEAAKRYNWEIEGARLMAILDTLRTT